MSETKSHETLINYDDRGKGEPALLFMPGWCGSRNVFNNLLARSASYRRTLALDWRGHGKSEVPIDDFGESELVDDAISVIEAAGVEHVVPVAMAHSGWIAIELRRKLGQRVPKLVLLDWIIMEAPPPFLAALQSLQDPARWHQAREQLFSMWLQGLNIPELTRYVREDMGSYPYEMWARAGREISAAYTNAGSPLKALATLDPPVPVLHLYAQPDDPAFLAAQQSFSVEHPWFQVCKVQAQSHFPLIEAPDEIASTIEQFVAE